MIFGTFCFDGNLERKVRYYATGRGVAAFWPVGFSFYLFRPRASRLDYFLDQQVVLIVLEQALRVEQLSVRSRAETLCFSLRIM